LKQKRYFNRAGNNGGSMEQARIHCIKVILL